MVARSAARTNDREMRHAFKTGPGRFDLPDAPAIPGERRRRQGPGKGNRYPGGPGSVLSSVGPQPLRAADLPLPARADCGKEVSGGQAAKQVSCLFLNSVADVRICGIYIQRWPKAIAGRSFFAVRLRIAHAEARH